MIANLAKKHVPTPHSRKIFYGIIIFYLLYLLYVSIASFRGVFDDLTLPPKIVQLTTFPLALFLMGVVYNLRFYKRILKVVPIEQLIVLHRFRLIGSFFIVLLILQQLPPFFALIAGIGDIITALSSVWIAKNLEDTRKYARTFAIAWNTFGLVDILFTSVTAIILTKLTIDTGVQGVEVLASFPFCFIPAFAPATIIFLHLSIYRKLFVKKFS